MSEPKGILTRFFSALFGGRAKLGLKPSVVGISRARTQGQIVEYVARAPAILRSAADVVVSPFQSDGGWFGKTFILLVLAPTIVFLLYAAIFQSHRYVAETRLTVRGAQEQRGAIADASSLIGKFSGGPKASIQDSYIVLNYIKSQAILHDIGGKDYLEKYFSSSSIDYFSRLKSDPKIEDLQSYWLERVHANVDTVSGIATVKVDAFTPNDASQIALDIVRLSEKLINEMTIRSRTDAVGRDEREVTLAAEKLATARDNLTEFRDRSAIIDPASRAQSVGEMIGKLTLDKIGIENTLATLQGSLNADSPTQRIQRSKLAAIDQQIVDLKKLLTGSQNDGAVSAQVASYERLKLEEQFTERMYTIAQNSYTRARQELEKQQLYVVVVVAPTLPERATYPKIVASTLLLFAALFMFWAIGALVAASINDQMV